MTINKKVIIPLLFVLFAAFGLEEIAGEFVKFGPGRWTDSTGWNVSNRKSKIDGDLNITGAYLLNGSPFTGTGVSYDTVVTKKDTARFLHKTDSVRFALIDAGSNAFVGDVTANSFQTLNGVVCDALTVTGGSTSSISGVLTVQDSSGFANDLTIGATLTALAGLTLSDATKIIINSASDILYKVTTGGAHVMETTSGRDVMKADSTSGTGTLPQGLESIWGGTKLLYQKYIRGVAPTGNATVSYAHGLTDGTIIGASIWLRHDTTYTGGYAPARNWNIQPGATYDATILYYAGYDSLYCWARFPVAATATRGDSLYFLLTYIK